MDRIKTRAFMAITAAIFMVSHGHTEEPLSYITPLTEWGVPDLQGVWNFSSNTPLERPARFGDRQFLTAEEIANTRADIENSTPDDPSDEIWFEQDNLDDIYRTSAIIYPENGKTPPRREGVPSQFNTMGDDLPGVRPVRSMVGGIGKDGPEDRGLTERCLVGMNSGPPFIPRLYNNNVQIFQNKDTVVIMTEMIHDARIVPIGKKTGIDDRIRLWSGDSRGWWEEETLVVETRNFNGLRSTFGTIAAVGSNFDMVLTERFTRRSDTTVDYEFTIDDPTTFTDRITAIIPMRKADGLIYEYACHEGNDALLYILRGARLAETN